jgi:hypothetical protein
MKLKSLVGIIQFLLKGLPTRDDPVLHSRLFALVCRYFGQRSEQFTGLILPTESYRYVGQIIYILANKTRDPQRHLYHKLLRYIEQFHPQKKLVSF